MKKFIAALLLSIGLTAGVVAVDMGVASAAQKNFTSCSSLTPWERNFSVYYYNPTLNTTIYVRLNNGNLYAVPVTNDYLGQNVKGKYWRAVGAIPGSGSLPSVAILTATEIVSATCI